MKLLGKYGKQGSFWVAEVPFIQLMEQGRTRKESLLMIRKGIEALINIPGFKCEVVDSGDGEFTLSSPDVKHMSAFILRRLREAQGLTIREVAAILGMKSHTEYARHESGKVAMTMETFNRYVEKISAREVVIQIA